MNENIDLTEILKDAPKGTTLWSPIFGECRLFNVNTDPDYTYPIKVELEDDDYSFYDFTKDGRVYHNFRGECVLFPSRDQRDWSKFQVPQKKKVKVTLHPFDKLLVRDDAEHTWVPALLRFIDGDKDSQHPYYIMFGISWKYCIPYNSDTAHLLETTEECPIDYDIEFDKSYKE